MRNVLVTAVVVAIAAVVFMSQGCVQVGGKEPLVRVERSQPVPTGPGHEACQARINMLQADLDECKLDRKNDKIKWEEEKKKLERERDMYRDRLRRYEKD